MARNFRRILMTIAVGRSVVAQYPCTAIGRSAVASGSVATAVGYTAVAKVFDLVARDSPGEVVIPTVPKYNWRDFSCKQWAEFEKFLKG
jgi:hypothetical protein